MRILMVSDNYPPFIGGAHRQTQLLARELSRRGHTVSVATVWHSGLPEVEDDGGVQVYRLKQLRTALSNAARAGVQQHQPPFADPVTVWALRGLIERLQPDVAHAYGWMAYSCAAALRGWPQIPLLLSGRDYALSCATRELMYQGETLCDGPALGKCLSCATKRYGAVKGALAVSGVFLGGPLLRERAQGVHSVSSFVQYTVERDFLRTVSASEPESRLQPDAEPESRLQPGGSINRSKEADKPTLAVIPSFREDEADRLDPEGPELQPYLAQLPSESFILFVGALRVVKGVEQLLLAYQRLCQPPPLVLIGTVEHDTPRELPANVHVLQNFPHRAVLAAWDRCLFGVLPSLWPEPLGSVVYEGLSRGKAVIGTRPGGHADIIQEGVSGRLVPPGDVDALAGAMQQLIEHPDLRERFGQAGRERARQFTATSAVPRFEQLYRQIIAQSASSYSEIHVQSTHHKDTKTPRHEELRGG